MNAHFLTHTAIKIMAAAACVLTSCVSQGQVWWHDSPSSADRSLNGVNPLNDLVAEPATSPSVYRLGDWLKTDSSPYAIPSVPANSASIGSPLANSIRQNFRSKLSGREQLFHEAFLAWMHGDIERARSTFQELVEASEQSQTYDEVYIDSLCRLSGIAYEEDDDVQKAEALAAKAFANAERVSGTTDDKHRVRTAAVRAMAAAAKAADRWSDAERLLNENLRAAQRLFGNNAKQTAGAWRDLASMYSDADRPGDLDKSIHSRQLAVQIWKANGNQDEYLDGLEYLTFDLAKAKRYGEQEQICRFLVEQNSKYSVDLQITRLVRLGECLASQNRFSESEAILVRAFQMEQEGNVRDTTAATSLGNLYCQMGRYGEAEMRFKLALTQQKKMLAERQQDPDSDNDTYLVYEACRKLPYVLMRQNKLNAAESCLHEKQSLLLDVNKEFGNELTPTWRTAKVLDEFAMVYALQGRFKESEASRAEAVAILASHSKPGKADDANRHNATGIQQMGQRQYRQAEASFRGALKGYRKSRGPKSPECKVAMRNLAMAIKQQGYHQEAGVLYRWAANASSGQSSY